LMRGLRPIIIGFGVISMAILHGVFCLSSTIETGGYIGIGYPNMFIIEKSSLEIEFLGFNLLKYLLLNWLLLALGVLLITKGMNSGNQQRWSCHPVWEPEIARGWLRFARPCEAALLAV
jgi:hypothetical protein